MKELQDFISLHVITSDKAILNDDSSIASAVKMINWLWDYNKLTKWFKLSDFYNTVLCDNITLREDYNNWKKQQRSTYDLD